MRVALSLLKGRGRRGGGVAWILSVKFRSPQLSASLEVAEPLVWGFAFISYGAGSTYCLRLGSSGAGKNLY